MTWIMKKRRITKQEMKVSIKTGSVIITEHLFGAESDEKEREG